MEQPDVALFMFKPTAETSRDQINYANTSDHTYLMPISGPRLLTNRNQLKRQRTQITAVSQRRRSQITNSEQIVETSTTNSNDILANPEPGSYLLTLIQEKNVCRLDHPFIILIDNSIKKINGTEFIIFSTVNTEYQAKIRGIKIFWINITGISWYLRTFQLSK